MVFLGAWVVMEAVFETGEILLFDAPIDCVSKGASSALQASIEDETFSDLCSELNTSSDDDFLVAVHHLSYYDHPSCRFRDSSLSPSGDFLIEEM